MHSIDTKIDEYQQKYKDYDEKKIVEEKKAILKELESFNGCPFTLQRLCELVITPESYYKNTRKYLFALLKLVSITGKLEELNLEDYNREVIKLLQEYEKLGKMKVNAPIVPQIDTNQHFEVETKISMDTTDD
eukprot:TRINITY_DN1388_c0_g1_i2.p1 TRINITY_DN1388_c0_g1~~TRINITY_DN1388_c0_g1_i2.p1  ORF type:complete len:133 (+),score=33.98 TRINITY_DN1388_c0_g1_i2:305-703(+)